MCLYLLPTTSSLSFLFSFSSPQKKYSHTHIHTHTHTHTYTGLYTIVARERFDHCGANHVETTHTPTYVHIFLEELYEGPQLLLLCVGVFYALLGSMEESLTALVVILLMINAEIVTEYRAKQALAKLQSTVGVCVRACVCVCI
jgi:magnesium-transporting ATPase (P-type)